MVDNGGINEFSNCLGEVYKWQIFIQNIWDEFGSPKKYTWKTTFYLPCFNRTQNITVNNTLSFMKNLQVQASRLLVSFPNM